MSKWPWAANLRTGLVVKGLDLAVANGLARSVGDAAEVAALLCAGIPDDLQISPAYGPHDGGFALAVDQKHIKMFQYFHQTDQGLEVEYGAYRLPPDRRGEGNARHMLRNAFLAYERLKAVAVVLHANETIGGYVWAKYGARAQYPQEVREELRHRCSQAVTQARIKSHDLRVLEPLISNTSANDAMYDLARLQSDDGRRIGMEVLLGSSWSAYWDLEDEEQMNHVRSTLSEPN